MSHLRLTVLVTAWWPAGQVTSAVDETLECRWEPQIHKHSHWCDSLASSRHVNVSSGLHWLVFVLVVYVPWPLETLLSAVCD